MKGPTKRPSTFRLPRDSAWQAAWLLLCVGFLGLLAPAARAAVLDGVFEVRSAYVTVDNGVYQLNARVEYPRSEEIRTALIDGVTLYFDLEALVERQRRYWTDATVVELTLRRELSYHAVKERFVVRDLARGDLDYFLTLDQALGAIGVVSDFPVVVEPQLQADDAYDISVRASMRRGSMPDAVRALIWWSDSWHRRTDWYTWSLPR